MRRRTYTFPIIITLVMILCIVFLVAVFLQSPYEKAMRNGDRAMKNYNYDRAVSEYTIAQNVDSDQPEAYTKGLNALVLLNSGTVARDFLSTVNSCIEFCGTGSITDRQIVDAIEILVTLGNTEAACEILEHLHQSYSGSELINEKIKQLNLEIHQDSPYAATDEANSVIAPVIPTTPEITEQLPDQTVDASGEATEQNNESSQATEPSETASPLPEPSSQPAPSPSQAPAVSSASPPPSQAPAKTPEPSAATGEAATQQATE